MCSASQPSSRACTDAMRNEWHFLPSSALPPYPEPYDQIMRSSGKWTMYFVSLHGQGTSSCPDSSGAPTECRPDTNGCSAPSLVNSSSAGAPTLVMMCIDATTYGESVISTPSMGCSALSGPM